MAPTVPNDQVTQEATLRELGHGPVYSFKDWPNPKVPDVAAGVYTVWRGDEFIYVGMSGRGLTADDILRGRNERGSRKGLYSRLESHASGRRSGDQFCVYVCDRFVVPNLSRDEMKRLAAGGQLLDGLTKLFVRESFRYRFAETEDGETALRIEKMVRDGALGRKPMLNPTPGL